MEAEERERVPALLLEAIESLPEPDRKLVLAHLINCALLTSRREAIAERSGAIAGGPAGFGGFLPVQHGPGLGARSESSAAKGWSLAEVMRMPDEALRAALADTAPNSRAAEPTPSILRLLAEGRTTAEVASELGLSEEQVTDELERARPLAARLLAALRARLTERGTEAGESALRYLRTPGPAGQQLVPVRFPEEQHARLKEWCASNGFSMAVVVRGLVDRFLDEYDPREA